GIRDPLVTGVQTCALPIYGLKVAETAQVSLSSHWGQRPRDITVNGWPELLEAWALLTQDESRDWVDDSEEFERQMLEGEDGRVKIGRASCRERVEVAGGGE